MTKTLHTLFAFYLRQTEIQQKVIESFNGRKRAKHLLECAKRAVEIAIEQDEQAAMDWLDFVNMPNSHLHGIFK